MEYDEINLNVKLGNEIYAIPCNLAISDDGDKLLVVFKQEKVGVIKELRNLLIKNGKRME